jgi:TonB-dependent SusC/RagA subfamily outer membrane receptor
MRATSAAALLILGIALPLRGQDDTASLSGALTARVPGVQVQSRDGSAGAGPIITIRGAAEPLTPARPLLIIDGVRVDNTQGVDNPSLSGHPSTARFDDIDPSEIERIEVLPGAAAAALYGPGAGNGVILVTTRHSSTRFLHGSVSAEGGWTTMPGVESPSYFAWGHATNGTFQQCLTYQAAAGQCVVDSVTHFNPMRDATTTPITAGTMERYGGEVGASVEHYRGYLTAHYAGADGNLMMPRGGLPPVGVGYRLNTTDRADVRGQVSADISPTIDVGVAAGYISEHQRVPGVDSLLIAGALNPGYGPPGWPQGSNYPEQLVYDLASQSVSHTTVSGYGNWHPFSPLTLHVRAGEDGTAETWAWAPYPGSQGPFGPGVVRAVYPVHGGIIQFTSDLGGDLALHPAAWLAWRTAVGLQYLDAHLKSGPTTADRAQSVYADEGVTIAERLTIDAGARWNHEWIHRWKAASTAIDPSLRGRLMLLGRDSTAHIGLRGAIGETHTLPPPDVAAGVLLLPAQYYCVTFTTSCFPPGHPRFVAERQREAEGGVIAGLADDRLTLDIAVFERRNVNVLVPARITVDGMTAFADSGAGITRDDGLEVTVGARPIVTRALNWDVTLTGFVNENKLLRLAYPGPLRTPSNLMQLAVGDPVYGIWAASYSYADANHDGVVEPSEVTVASSPSFVGPARPTREAALSSSIALWHGGLTIGALVDYRGGFVLPDLVGFYQAALATSRAENLPGASLADQARAVAIRQSLYFVGQVQRVNAIRWRELSLSAPIPLPGPAVRVTVAARNLALWTNYRGPDPDADVTTGNVEQLRLPQPRTWLIRATAAF